MASDIKVTSLTAVGGVGQVAVTVLASSPTGMSCLPYMRPAAVDIYIASTDSFVAAVLSGTVNSDVGVLVVGGLAANVTRYFWAIARDADGNEGARYPAAGGVSATTLTTQPGPNSVGPNELQDSAVQTRHYANLSVTNAKIQSMVADKLLAGTISASIGITSPSITGGTITGSTIRTSLGSTSIGIGQSPNALTGYRDGAQLIYIGTASSTPLASFTTHSAANVTLRSIGGSSSTQHAIRGQSQSGGSGLVGVSTAGGGWALYAEIGPIGPFTGAHDALLPNDSDVAVGEIVVAEKVWAKSGVDDALLEVRVSESVAERGAYGVVSKITAFDAYGPIAALPAVWPDQPPTPVRQFLADRFKRLTVNGVGEGLVLVCGRGGDIAVGDYICTSSMRGKGQRQNDAYGDACDYKRRCTVARATQAAIFDDPDQVMLIACVYECG